MKIPGDFNMRRDEAVAFSSSLGGLVTDRELRFLFMLGAIKTTEGDVLEIGSYLGRSTIVLSKAARMAGNVKINAVDPLTLPAATDFIPRDINVRQEFFNNIRPFADSIEFFEMTSQDLAKQWEKPLRLLWIDGDHTFKGVQSDFLNFSNHLVEGGIIAFHDVFNGHVGPIQVFISEVLQNRKFGACGIVGAIGWAMYCGNKPNRFEKEKERLCVKLIRALPHLVKKKRTRIDNIRFKLKRAFIPHDLIAAENWIKMIS
jgi:MMP 1-O-methyltransferase